jgi:hypothetical protein
MKSEQNLWKHRKWAENQYHGIKGIASRDWGRLQIVLFDRFEVRTIPPNIYFEFEIFYNRIFSKLPPYECASALDFLKEEDFPQSSFCSSSFRFCSMGNKMRKTTADQLPRGSLRVSRKLPEQKNSFLRCSANLLITAGAKTRQVALQEIPSMRKSEHDRSNSLRNTSPPKSGRTPQEEPLFVALSSGATSSGNDAPERSSCGLFPPRWSKLLCGKSRPKAYKDGRHFEKFD